MFLYVCLSVCFYNVSIVLQNLFYFTLQVIDGSYKAGLFVVYLISMIMTIFVFSFYANKLTEASQQVSDVIYFENWIEKPIWYKKSLMLICIRSRKITGITAAKFYFMTLGSLTSFLKVSFSYWTLLYTIYQKKQGEFCNIFKELTI